MRTQPLLPLLAETALRGHLIAVLAADAAPVNLSPLVAGVTGQNWATRKPLIAAGVVRLGKDADATAVLEVLDQLDSVKDQVAAAVAGAGGGDPAADPVDPNAVPNRTPPVPDGAGGLDPDDGDDMGSVTDAFQAAMVTAGLDQDTIASVMEALNNSGGGDVTTADDNKPVAKAAMDEAITTAVAAAAKASADRFKAVKAAERAVEPYVGRLAQDHDTSDDVYRGAFAVLKVDVKDVHPSAFPAILAAQPKPGFGGSARRSAPAAAMDAEASKSYDTRYGGASSRLKNA